MRNIHLDKLKIGLPGITKNIGAFLWEAAVVCLKITHHNSEAVLKIEGDVKERVVVQWSELEESIDFAWQDSNEAVEYGATAVALLLTEELTDYQIGGRSYQDSRTDYWLSKNPTSRMKSPDAFLEISGILQEQKGNTVAMRTAKKRKIAFDAEKREPVIIVVVAFSPLKAKIIET